MTTMHIAAIDLGASSGRVMLATYQKELGTIALHEIHRFSNKLIQQAQHVVWDLDHLEKEIIVGLNKIAESNITLNSIGIDTWGVDYVLLNQQGERVGPSYAYRDHRTDGVMERVQQALGSSTLYQKTGIQFLPFNTLYQLKALAEEDPTWLSEVTDLIMIPDYLIYRLTGQLNREYTNATTTQLVNVQTDNWDDDLLTYLGLPKRWFGQIRHPGNQVGYWRTPQGAAIPVISVASHDTASAVIATPLKDEYAAYLCSGTWSLMGLDMTKPCTNQAAMAANITNEGGINGRYRVLKNIMGLWLFQRICSEFDIQDIPRFVAAAAQESPFLSLINPNDVRFLNPPVMSEAIKAYCLEYGQPVPDTIAKLARCIFDSLAMLYKQVAMELSALNSRPLTQLHVVGGGCQNEFLNQLCADICGFNVVAGPIEASTLGNIGCQLMALDELPNVEAIRALIVKNFTIKTFTPQQSTFEPIWLAQKWQQFCALSHNQ